MKEMSIKGINFTQFWQNKVESVEILRVKQHFQSVAQHFQSVAQHFYMTLEVDIHILYNVCPILGSYKSVAQHFQSVAQHFETMATGLLNSSNKSVA